MLDGQFLGLNVHFAINLGAALVCFAVFWLIFDAWLGRHQRQELIKWLGFLTLMLGFLFEAAALQSSTSLLGAIDIAADALRFIGYILIAVGQLIEPLQAKPDVSSDPDLRDLTGSGSISSSAPAAKSKSPANSAITLKVNGTSSKLKSSSGVAIAGVNIGFSAIGAALSLAAAGVGALYLRRATTGLERHLLPVAHAFGWIALSELLRAVTHLGAGNNPIAGQIIAPFGVVWWASLAALAIGSFLLGHWVWNYLTKRLVSQLYMTLITQTIVLFLVATFSFTYLLLQDIKSATLRDLTTASRVLNYAVTSRQAETVAQAESAASGTRVAAAIVAKDRAVLRQDMGEFFAKRQLSTLVVTDASGAVWYRAEDPDRYGDSRSANPLVRRALVGQPAASVQVAGGVVAPNVSLVATSPVRDSAGLVVGTVTIGRAISSAFVDGIKASTGLESTIYGGDVRAATTLTASGSSDRAIGIKLGDDTITDTVLKQGKTYTGTLQMQNKYYLTAISPLRDVNNQTVGMLQAASPASQLYDTAEHSLQLTFFTSLILVLLAAYPLYRLAVFLESQLT